MTARQPKVPFHPPAAVASQPAPTKIPRQAQPDLKGKSFEAGKAALHPKVPFRPEEIGKVPFIPESDEGKVPYNPDHEGTKVPFIPPKDEVYGPPAPKLVHWNNEAIDVKLLDKLDVGELAGLKDSLDEVKGRVDNLKTTAEVVDLLISGRTTMSPEETIRSLGVLVNATKSMTGIPGVKQFLEMYSEAISTIATRVGEISEMMYRGEVAAGQIVHGGMTPYFGAVLNYVKLLEKAKAPIDVPSDVVSWTKDNRSVLILVTGAEPGVERKTKYGVDAFAKDDENLSALRQWFFDHRKAIRKYAFGDALLE